MIRFSNANPIQFWPKGVTTFNDGGFGFVLSRPYYHELLDTDLQKLQLVDFDNRAFTLVVKDALDNVITNKDFTVTEMGDGDAVNDIEFTFKTLPVAVSDTRIRLYIVQISDTFDSTFDTTFHPDDYVYKSDLLDIRSAIYANMGWGSQLLQYKSLSNYYGIVYPNTSNYFSLRVPCKFYNERMQETLNEIQLSDNVLATSRTQKFQTYLETYQVPAYMLKKIQAALSHDVAGSVIINGVEFEAGDGMEWNQVEAKSPFFKGKIWLTDKTNFVRNII